MLEVAGEAGVDAALVDAIAWRTSGYDASKQHEGGYGLMQVGVGTAMEWAAAHGIEVMMATDLLDARTNLQAGTWYLSRALARWLETDDAVIFALADYIAGPDAVRSWAGKSMRAADLLAAMKGTEAGAFVQAVSERARKHR